MRPHIVRTLAEVTTYDLTPTLNVLPVLASPPFDIHTMTPRPHVHTYAGSYCPLGESDETEIFEN